MHPGGQLEWEGGPNRTATLAAPPANGSAAGSGKTALRVSCSPSSPASTLVELVAAGAESDTQEVGGLGPCTLAALWHEARALHWQAVLHF